MQIVLNKGEKNERTVTMPRKKAIVVREALDVRKRMATEVSDSKSFDEELAIVCRWFDDLTVDDVLNGMYADEIIPFIFNTCEYLISGTLLKFESKNA